MDGYRILAEKDGAEVRLRSRNGNDLTRSFPELGPLHCVASRSPT